jgi:ABC-type antimicrobial peptide transport system permease subunit
VSKPLPVVVNRALAHRLFGEKDPLGRTVRDYNSKTPDYEIIGVVSDSKYDSLRKDVVPTAYFPIGAKGGSFEIRTATNPKELVSSIQEVLNSVDHNLVLLNVKTQMELIDQALYQERLLACLSSLFGVLALSLACIGLYTLLSYETAQRTREIGIRVALGANPRDVLSMVVGNGMILVVVGFGLGASAAFGVTRYIESLLCGVNPIDPITLGGVSILLFAVTMAACYAPARRASSVDPMISLRYE